MAGSTAPRALAVPRAAVRLMVAGLLVLLGACAGLPPAPQPAPSVDPAAEHAARVAAFDAWQVAARLAVQREDKGFSGDLRWRQTGAAYDLRVMAPLNGGTFALAGDGAKVELVTPKGERYQADDPATLMREHLGWSIALDGTRYWIRGLPRPGGAVTGAVRDGAGRYTDFAQDGWRISILEYMDYDGLALPRRLFLAQDSLKVRIVIKQWQHLQASR